jgi:hypothetical protein
MAGGAQEPGERQQRRQIAAARPGRDHDGQRRRGQIGLAAASSAHLATRRLIAPGLVDS